MHNTKRLLCGYFHTQFLRIIVKLKLSQNAPILINLIINEKKHTLTYAKMHYFFINNHSVNYLFIHACFSLSQQAVAAGHSGRRSAAISVVLRRKT